MKTGLTCKHLILCELYYLPPLQQQEYKKFVNQNGVLPSFSILHKASSLSLKGISTVSEQEQTNSLPKTFRSYKKASHRNMQALEVKEFRAKKRPGKKKRRYNKQLQFICLLNSMHMGHIQ